MGFTQAIVSKSSKGSTGARAWVGRRPVVAQHARERHALSCRNLRRVCAMPPEPPRENRPPPAEEGEYGEAQEHLWRSFAARFRRGRRGGYSHHATGSCVGGGGEFDEVAIEGGEEPQRREARHGIVCQGPSGSLPAASPWKSTHAHLHPPLLASLLIALGRDRQSGGIMCDDATPRPVVQAQTL